MSDWTARLKSAIAQTEGVGTAITDETPLVSVSSVHPRTLFENSRAVSAVSSVGVVALFENTALSAALVATAMRRCDQFNDNEAAREQMRQDVLATPLHLRADLLDHFTGKTS